MSRRGIHMCISESHEEMLERSESIRGWNDVRSLKRRLVSKAHNGNPYIRSDDSSIIARNFRDIMKVPQNFRDIEISGGKFHYSLG